MRTQLFILVRHHRLHRPTYWSAFLTEVANTTMRQREHFKAFPSKPSCPFFTQICAAINLLSLNPQLSLMSNDKARRELSHLRLSYLTKRRRGEIRVARFHSQKVVSYLL